MQKKNYIIYVKYTGYGNGADKTVVTTYEIGNPEIAGELQTKTLTGSGARSITIEDLQEMTTTPLSIPYETAARTNPTVPIYMPTLSGANVEGQCLDTEKKSNLAHTYKSTSKTDFTTNLKPEYNNLSDKIFKDSPYYWVGSRLVYANSSGAGFYVCRVYYSNVAAYNPCSGNSSSFISPMGALGVRPVVYLESGVQLNEISAGVWKLVQ